MREPRQEAFGRVLGAALFAELHRAVGRAEAQPRAGVDDDAQPIVAARSSRHRARLVAVEHAQEFVRVVAREHRLDFARQHQRRRRRPRRQQARVHQQPLAFDARPAAARAATRAARRGPARRESRRACRCDAAGDGRRRRSAGGSRGCRARVTAASPSCRHLAQHGERFRAAVDEVADQPQPVGRAARTPIRSSSWQNSAWQPWMSPIA